MVCNKVQIYNNFSTKKISIMRILILFSILILTSFLTSKRGVEQTYQVTKVAAPAPQKTALDSRLEQCGCKHIPNIKEALNLQDSLGIPYQVTLTQAYAESGNGTSELAQAANNLFGIKRQKYRDKSPFYQSCPTCAKWRKYQTVQAGFYDYGHFLKNRLPHLWKCKTVDCWLAKIGASGYAANNATYTAKLKQNYNKLKKCK